MAEYSATSKAVAAPFLPIVVALAAGVTKTVLQVAVPATTSIMLLGWGLSFDGVSGTAVPVTCQLADTDVGASGLTSYTPDLFGNTEQQASLCVGGAALTGHGGGVTPTEGTIAVCRSLDPQLVHPQAGYAVWWPERGMMRVGASRFLRIRCTAAAAVDVIPWVVWTEPAV
jgi:hypothetical protein